MGEERQLVPGNFDVVLQDGRYEVTANGESLRSPRGNPIQTPNGAVVRMLYEELGSFPFWYIDDGIIVRPRPLGCYTMLSWQLDAYEHGNQGISDLESLAEFALSDPVLYPQAGPEQIEQRFAWAPIDNALQYYGGSIGYVDKLNEEVREGIREFVRSSWQAFGYAEKAVTETLGQTFHSFLSAMVLVSRQMSPDEYAHAILATSPLHGVFDFPSDEKSSPEEVHYKIYARYRDAARTAIKYLELTNLKHAEVERLVERGESERIEFKTTALGNPGTKPREQKKARESIMKAVAAMMSGDGGWVLIGVDDNNGRVSGIPELENQSMDEVQCALADNLHSKLSFSDSIRISMQGHQVNGKKIIVLWCPPAGRLVHILCNGKRKAFIRQGPRTIPCDV